MFHSAYTFSIAARRYYFGGSGGWAQVWSGWLA
jgi:hypothetical protein